MAAYVARVVVAGREGVVVAAYVARVVVAGREGLLSLRASVSVVAG